MTPAVRDARDDEAGSIADLLSRAAFGPTVSRLVAFPRTSPHGDVLVADNGAGAMSGAACCVSFGATGWIGALGVAPEARRRGLGRALTEAAIARLRDRGATTVLLFATDMGRPLYERLGFAAEGAATAWRGTAGSAQGTVQVRRLSEDDRARLAALDRAATGEDRSRLLASLATPAASSVALAADGDVDGFVVRAAWGGAAVVARTDSAAMRLLDWRRRRAGPDGRVGIGLIGGNDAGRAMLLSAGWTEHPGAVRMVRGAPLDWRPNWLWGQFNGALG
jgi:predicted N-acetyltransferase YhbS